MPPDFSGLVKGLYVMLGLLAIFIPLGIWKLVDIFIFLFQHIHIHIQ